VPAQQNFTILGAEQLPLPVPVLAGPRTAGQRHISRFSFSGRETVFAELTPTAVGFPR